jgi:hypothetical protein
LPDGNNTPFSSLENGIRDGGLWKSNHDLPPEVDCRVGVDCLSGTSIGHPPNPTVIHRPHGNPPTPR